VVSTFTRLLPEHIKVPLRRVRAGWRHWQRCWLEPVFSWQRVREAPDLYAAYLADWRRYTQLPGAEELRYFDSYPCVFDRSMTTPFDAHYFYQDVWALNSIAAARPDLHADVGSHIFFVGMLTAVTEVLFLDIRPLKAQIQRMTSLPGSILALPFGDNSVDSLSCLHVAEHIGLGRYGDPLDPQGTRKAARELARVLAPQGNLYFSLPIGRARVCFNAHRIHTPAQILAYFAELRLVDFAAVDDRGRFHQVAAPADLTDASYACGLFHFRKV